MLAFCREIVGTLFAVELTHDSPGFPRARSSSGTTLSVLRLRRRRFELHQQGRPFPLSLPGVSPPLSRSERRDRGAEKPARSEGTAAARSSRERASRLVSSEQKIEVRPEFRGIVFP